MLPLQEIRDLRHLSLQSPIAFSLPPPDVPSCEVAPSNYVSTQQKPTPPESEQLPSRCCCSPPANCDPKTVGSDCCSTRSQLNARGGPLLLSSTIERVLIPFLPSISTASSPFITDVPVITSTTTKKEDRNQRLVALVRAFLLL